MKERKSFSHGTAVLGIAVLIAILAGCATTVPIKSVKKPTIDTSGIQRMGIKEFENKSGTSGDLPTQIIHYLNDKTSQVINSAEGQQFFTIVAATDPNAEGVFSGELRRIVSSDTTEQGSAYDPATQTMVPVTIHVRTVTVEFVYSVTSTRTGMAVAGSPVTKSGSQSDRNQDYSRLADPLTLARKVVDSQLSSFKSDIIPTTVSTNAKLMKEKSKDKVLKERFKMAETLVKNGNLEGAIELFDELASTYNSAAAKENARIIRSAIASDIAAQEQMAAIKSDTSGLIEKAVEGAVAMLSSNMSAETTFIFMKSNSNEQSLLDNTMDLISKSITQAGKLKIVDRQNQDLINAELQHQMSGNVSDDSYVSIGKQLGAQYIVLCWIGGEMSSRRLNVRILSIETSQIVKEEHFEI